MDYSDWREAGKLSGRDVEAIDVALNQFSENHFSSSGNLKHFTVELRRLAEKLAVSFFPEYDERSSRGLPGRNKYGAYTRSLSVSEILEICGYTEIAATHKLNDGLQFVFLFACDANLAVQQLALHFESL